MRRLPSHLQEVPDLDEVRRALTLFTYGLGDHVLALPAFRALSSLLPGRLELLTAPSAPDLFFGDVGFARIHQVAMSFASSNAPLFDVDAVLVRIGMPDLLLTVFEEPYREWAALADRVRARWFLDPVRPMIRGGSHHRHTVDRAFRVVRSFRPDWGPDMFASPFPLPRASVDFALFLREALGSRKLLVLHAETATKKCWPAERFLDAVHRFSAAHPEYFVVELARRSSWFGEAARNTILSMVGLPLASCIAVSAVADLVLCVDSLFLHVADLWRVPVVALFGPTDPAQWGCRFTPIFRHVRRRSMGEIPVNAVLGAMDEVLVELCDRGDTRLPLSAGATERSFLWR